MKMTSMKKFCVKGVCAVVVFALCAIVACSSEPSVDAVSVKWQTSNSDTAQVGKAGGSAALILAGVGTAYQAEIIDGSEWASFKPLTQTSVINGTVSERPLYIYIKALSGTVARKATIRFTFEGEAPVTFYVEQLTKEYNWAEMPEEVNNSNYVYTTHFMTLSNSKVRNYSLCFDKTKRAALWVAYPLHSVYLGSVSRTDQWALDPNVSTSYQANVVKYSYRGNYDRGHQLPSADRLATTEANDQTFYMTNMTPQLDRLNQDMWAKLEAKVRNNRCSDTLYVVTGAYFANTNGSTTDNNGNTCPLPTHYFKVLLRTKTGNTGKAIKDCNASELKSIGFWVEHKSYGDIQPPTSICTTVQDIEQKTGFTFFPQVDASVKSQNEPSLWSIN